MISFFNNEESRTSYIFVGPEISNPLPHLLTNINNVLSSKQLSQIRFYFEKSIYAVFTKNICLYRYEYGHMQIASFYNPCGKCYDNMYLIWIIFCQSQRTSALPFSYIDIFWTSCTAYILIKSMRIGRKRLLISFYSRKIGMFT